MNIKHNKKKEELRKDPVMDAVAEAHNFFKHHSKHLLTFLIVIAVVSAAVLIFNNIKERKIQQAKRDFSKALILRDDQKDKEALEAFLHVFDTYKGTPQAVYSAFIIGHHYRDQEKYDEAISWFQQASKGNKDAGFISGESLEALAVCYEAKGDITKAQEYFELALKDESIPHRHAAIRWKMALINKKQGNTEKVKYYCGTLISDSTAVEYKQKAENLLAVADLL